MSSRVGDVDGDGDLDLAGTAYGLSRLGLWRNQDGDPIQWTREVAGALAGALVLDMRDLDANSSLDVVAVASETTRVARWRIGDFVPAGTITGSPITVGSDALTLDCALDAELPPGTTVGVEFRTTSTVDHLGFWREIECGQPVPVVQYGPAVLQHRLRLATEEPMVSPLVRALRFEWSSELSATPPRRTGDRVRP